MTRIKCEDGVIGKVEVCLRLLSSTWHLPVVVLLNIHARTHGCMWAVMVVSSETDVSIFLSSMVAAKNMKYMKDLL